MQGLLSIVRDEENSTIVECTIRRILKTLTTDKRHVVAAGDIVWFRPEGKRDGIIERVELRHGVVSRTSRGLQHVLVPMSTSSIVMSAVSPGASQISSTACSSQQRRAAFARHLHQ